MIMVAYIIAIGAYDYGCIYIYIYMSMHYLDVWMVGTCCLHECVYTCMHLCVFGCKVLCVDIWFVCMFVVQDVCMVCVRTCPV